MLNVRFGSLAATTSVWLRVRFTLESCRGSHKSARPLWAKSGLVHRSKQHPYSITSSVSASSVGGAVMPSVLAVFRLMTNSYLVGR